MVGCNIQSIAQSNVVIETAVAESCALFPILVPLRCASTVVRLVVPWT